MNSDLIILIVQVIAALGVVVSVIYLGVQIHQQNEITKAQFGHSLTQRQYERYFATAKDGEFANFLSKDWSSDELTDAENWRSTMFIIMCLVDIFDVYEKVKKGFVDKKHLDIRMNALKFGTMKTDKARSAWDFGKLLEIKILLIGLSRKFMVKASSMQMNYLNKQKVVHLKPVFDKDTNLLQTKIIIVVFSPYILCSRVFF